MHTNTEFKQIRILMSLNSWQHQCGVRNRQKHQANRFCVNILNIPPTLCKLPVHASFCDFYQWDQCGFKTSGLKDCAVVQMNRFFSDIQIRISQLRHHSTAHTSVCCRGPGRVKERTSALERKRTGFVFPEAEWQQRLRIPAGFIHSFIQAEVASKPGPLHGEKVI